MADSNVDMKGPPAPVDEAEEQPDLTFHGTNGVECEDFINSVRCRALEQGKIRDNDWLVTFIKSCCRDDALEFLETLDDSVKGDWKQLRKALLKKYPAPLWRDHKSVLLSPSPSAISDSFPKPTPAAAPPPRPLGPLPPPNPGDSEASFRGLTQNFLFKGCIKVFIPSDGNSDSSRFEAYISNAAESNYERKLKLTQDKTKALLLGYSPSQKPYAVMSILKCKCGKDCLANVGQPFKCNSAYGVWDFLVADWNDRSSLSPKNEPKSADLVAVDTYTVRNVERLAMWRMAPGCDLTPVRIASGAAHHAEVVVKPADLSIRLDAKLLNTKVPKSGGWVHAELRFEPFLVGGVFSFETKPSIATHVARK